MVYRDLRDFIAGLEGRGQLKRISQTIDPNLEMTEICDRTLRAGGPALLFENPQGSRHPGAGQPVRHARARRVRYGRRIRTDALRDIGRLLAMLKEPEPPQGMKDAWQKLPLYKKVLDMAPKVVKSAPCQEHVIEGDEVDLARLPIQTCWPDDAGPLITWALVVTRGPRQAAAEPGHLPPAGHRPQQSHHALAGPARRRAGLSRLVRGASGRAVSGGGRAGRRPGHDSGRRHAGAGYPVRIRVRRPAARRARPNWCACLGSDLQVPASAEIILEGHIHPGEEAEEGPFGDHTGYYNEVERFPVFTIERITHRDNPIYHSTYTGRPPDEPSMLGVALNEVFVPILQKQFPEITDFYLPPEGCSYRVACVSMKKQYPGHAKRVMFGVWRFLRQFMYTKFVIVTDEDIDVRDWKDVIWAVTHAHGPGA